MNRGLVIGLAAATLAGIAWQGSLASAAFTPADTPTTTAEPAPVATVRVPATPSPTSSSPNSVPTATYVAPSNVVPTQDTVGDGVHEVGVDIAPGRWKTSGPDPDDIVPSCYWARLSSDDGEFESIIANGNPTGRASLTVKRSDKFVELSGGCEWVRVS